MDLLKLIHVSIGVLFVVFEFVFVVKLARPSLTFSIDGPDQNGFAAHHWLCICVVLVYPQCRRAGFIPLCSVCILDISG
jgi:hypothetical protein